MERSSPWKTLVSCSLSCFVVQLDFAIVNTALPAIQDSLSASLSALQWVINAFILALTVSIVTWGRLADLWGRRLINNVGIGAFGLASLGAGLAHSATELILFRSLQGVATAAVIPSAIALISHAFPAGKKGKAIGIWSSISAIGMAIGPVMGGVFVHFLSWRWIFYVNVPIALISLVMNLLFVAESRHEGAVKKIDGKGVALLFIGLLFLIGGLMHAPDWGWESGRTWGAFALAFGALFWFYKSEKKSPHPTIPFALFMNPGFLYASGVLVCLMFVFTAALFLLPLYLMNIHHNTALAAGLMLFPITGSIVLFSPVVGHYIDKISANKLMLVGLALYLISTCMQLWFFPETSLYFIIGALFLLGCGWACARNPATTQALASSPHHLAGTAAGVLWTLQNAGGALSIAITGTLFRTLFETTSSPASFLQGYHAAMGLLFAVTLLTALILMVGAVRNKSSSIF
jgi:EmrB/QacA subfamily drug resistance transporter